MGEARMPEFEGETVFERDDAAIGAEMDGAAVVLQSVSWTYADFDAVGGRIWALLAEPQSLDALTASLTAEFDVAGGDCRREVSAFLQTMVEKGFIAVQP